METLKSIKAPTKMKISASSLVRISVIIIAFISVILPLIYLFSYIGHVNIKALFSYRSFLNAILNSFLVASFAAFSSLFLGFLLAYILNKSNIRFKGIFIILLTAPMLIPSISHGVSFTILWGNNGILTKLFGFSQGITGFWAIGITLILYCYPISFIMFNDILKYQDRHIYLAADILGVSKQRQFKDLLLPYIAKPAISIFFTVFTLAFTDYGVNFALKGNFTTLPLYMYEEVIGRSNFGIGAFISLILLFPSILAFIIDSFKKDISNFQNNTSIIKRDPSNKRKIIDYIIFSGFSLIVLLPIIVFVPISFIKSYPRNIVFSFDNILKVFKYNATTYFLNSIIIALVVSIFGTAYTFFCAYLTSRTNSKLNKFLHLLSLLPIAIPGLVLGISFLLTFRGTILQGTIYLIFAINILHFFSSPYILFYNALNKINKNYETVSKTLSIPKWRLIKNVILPESFETILDSFEYFFVNCMVTISAVSFIATTNNKPLSLLINQFEDIFLLESAAFVALIIFITNVLVKLIIFYIKHKWRKKMKIEMKKLPKNEFLVLTEIEKENNKKITQRKISENLKISLGSVNSAIRKLQSEKLIDEMNITEKGIQALEPYRVKRAIFIAAGFGSRLVPLTLNTPKPLIRVHGKPMIEYSIDLLLAIGITDIIIVRGYLSEQFDVLKNKYPTIKFVENVNYKEANNIGSAVLVRDLLSNAYVLEADLILTGEHILTKYQYSSNYIGVPVKRTDDWCLSTQNGIVTKMNLGGENCYHMFGVSYWDEEDGKKLYNDILNVYMSPGGKERYWDQVALQYCIKNYAIEIRECTFDDVKEIDSYNELKVIDKTYDI